MKLPTCHSCAPVAVLVMACALGAPALAQTLAPINVTATRTEVPPFEVPASVDVLDGERIRGDGRAQVNLSESLALMPGLLARDRQNQAQDLQLSVRGFGARSTFGVRGVRLYVDGIPATMPDGQGQLSHIDLASVGRLELLRGPFSVLYGNSSGGVMQVFTEEGQGPLVLGGSVATGSYGLRRADVKASGAAGPMGYVLSAGRLSTNGFREHSAAEREVTNVRLDWALGDDSKLTLLANTLKVEAEDPLGLTRADFDVAPRSAALATTFNTRKTVSQRQIGAVYERKINADNQLRLMVYGGERATTQFQSIPVAVQTSPQHPGGVIGLDRNYGGLDARWTTRTALAQRPLEIVGGLAYDTMAEQRRGWQNFQGSTLGVQGALRRDEDNRVTSLDPYLQASWKPDARWTVNAGVRHSRVNFASADNYIVGLNGNDSGSVSYSATLPAAGVTFAPSEQWRVYAAAGRGFETPTFNELAYRPDKTGGLNFNLRPSRSDNFETGVKWRTAPGAATRMDATAAIFHTATQDEIVTQSSENGRATFQNAGATRRRGLELATSIMPVRHWLAQLSYTLLDARYRDAFACPVSANLCPAGRVPAGKRIPGTARNALAAEMGWRPPTGWRAGVDARYLSNVAVNDVNSDAAASFVTLGSHVGYVAEINRWTLAATARIDNLADRKYAGSVIVNEGNGRYFEPAAGRNYVLSLSANYRF